MPSSPSDLARELSPLLRRRGAELSMLLQLDEHAGDLPEVLDFKDLAASDAHAAVDDATRNLVTRELTEVVAALRRVQAGSYGLCTSCGEAIAEARLRALPSTPFCLACQAERERAGS